MLVLGTIVALYCLMPKKSFINSPKINKVSSYLPAIDQNFACKDYNRTLYDNGNVWVYIEEVTEDEFQNYLTICRETDWIENYYSPNCWTASYKDTDYNITINRNGEEDIHMTIWAYLDIEDEEVEEDD